MCYIFSGFEHAAFLRQVQYELCPQWKCKGNKNGSSVIGDFPTVWTSLKFLQKCVEKSCMSPAPFLQLSPLFASKLLSASSSQHAPHASIWNASPSESGWVSSCAGRENEALCTSQEWVTGRWWETIADGKIGLVFCRCSEVLQEVMVRDMSAQNHHKGKLQFVKGIVGGWGLQAPHFSPWGGLNWDCHGTIGIQGVPLVS